MKKYNVKYGKLKIIKFSGYRYSEKSKRRYALYLCKCDCGKEKIIAFESLISGHSKSCGCGRIEKLKSINTIHKMSSSKFYECWIKMKDRCINKKCKGYKNYGGRGITYDPKWENFLGFKEEMYMKYIYAKKQLGIEIPTIERINNNGNYNFENCIFISKSDQNNNTRKNRWFEAISPIGIVYKSKNQNDFAKEHNLLRCQINTCLNNKKDIYKNWKFRFLDYAANIDSMP